MHHIRTYLLDLSVIFLAAPIDKPSYNLGPVELKHFNFGFTVDFSEFEFCLDAFNMTVHNNELLFEIEVEYAFFKCQQKRYLRMVFTNRREHQCNARECVAMVVKMPLRRATMPFLPSLTALSQSA